MSSSTEPLLSSLCSICHINTPKYKCPRCTLQTCSLACSKRHKLWSECSGVRDATAFVPRKELFTVRGINDDYNFITSIERGMERADRILIDEKGLIPKRSEREPKKKQFKPRRDRNRSPTPEIFERDETEKRRRRNAFRVASGIKKSCVIVRKAPVGMQRNKDNKTSVGNSKSLVWQIEWITDDGNVRLDKLAETRPLGEGYEEICSNRARAVMSQYDLNKSKKRKQSDTKTEAIAKRRKIDEEVRSKPIVASSFLQDPRTSLWNVPSSKSTVPGRFIDIPREKPAPFKSPYYFYLLKPFTPSSQPKIVIPLDSSQPLSKLLRHQVVIEFPTIYVSKKKPGSMPKTFMMEGAFRGGERRDMRKVKGEKKAKGEGKGLVDYSDSDSDSESESESMSESSSDSNDSGKEEEVDTSDSDSSDQNEDPGEISWSESSSEEEGEEEAMNLDET